MKPEKEILILCKEKRKIAEREMRREEGRNGNPRV